MNSKFSNTKFKPGMFLIILFMTSGFIFITAKSSGKVSQAHTEKDLPNMLEEPEFTISQTFVYFTVFDGVSQTFTIKTNRFLTILNTETWLTQSLTFGTGNNLYLKITASGNPEFRSREATIWVTPEGLTPVKITVFQCGQEKPLVVNAGALSSLISGPDRTNITNLKLTGTLDARDFKFMRDEMPNLSTLDIFFCNIMNYSGTEGTMNSYFSYEKNAIPENAFLRKGSLVYIFMPKTLLSIKSRAFFECSKLYIVTSGSNEIENSAFAGCKNLFAIDFNSVIKIGELAFSECSSLTKVRIPSNAKEIGKQAFRSCTKLDSVYISASSIGDEAFSYCSNLSLIFLSENVTTIKARAFGYCTMVKSIVSGRKIPVDLSGEPGVFLGIDFNTGKLNVPKESYSLYANAVQWKNFLSISEMDQFDVSPQTLNIAEAQGSNGTFQITSNKTWFVMGYDNWLRTSHKSGSGNGTITLTADANTGLSKRTTTVVVSDNTGLYEKLIFVTQSVKQKTVNCEPGQLKSLLSLDELNSTANLKINGNIDARDFKVMRDNMPLLAAIDISEANIMAYNGEEGPSLNNQNYPANEIPESAFYSSRVLSLQSLNLPASLTSIASNAFHNCISLKSVDIPVNVRSIGRFAFRFCQNLESVKLSESLINLDISVFQGCKSLKSVTLPSKLTKIGDFAFQECSALKSVIFKNCVEKIGQNAFAGCISIDSLFINAKRINESSFYNCLNLKSVVLPSSVDTMENGIFWGCSALRKIISLDEIPIDLKYKDLVFDNVDKSTCELIVPKDSKVLYSVADQWKDFLKISELDEFKVSPNSILFNENDGTTIKIQLTTKKTWSISQKPDWLTTNPATGNGNAEIALKSTGNTGLNIRSGTIVFSSPGMYDYYVQVSQLGQVKTININQGELSVKLNNELNQIVRLKITGTIDARDFKVMRDNMPLLTDVDISEATIATYSGPEGTSYNQTYPANEIPAYAFFDSYIYPSKTNLQTLKLPVSLKSVGIFSFNGCSSLVNVDIPEGVHSIGNNAFSNCESLSSVSLPNTIKALSDYTFQNCISLKSITLPFGLSVIGEFTFSGCNSLIRVIFQSTVEEIKRYSFYECTSLDSLFINAKIIRDYAFMKTSNLKTIVLPASTFFYGSGVFSDCNSLRKMVVSKETPVDLKNSYSVFYNVNKTTCELFVPYGSSALYSKADQWKDFLNIKEMEEFRVLPNAITLNETEGSNAGAKMSTAKIWQVKEKSGWISLVPSSGTGKKDLTISAILNPDVAPRSGSIIFSSPGMFDYVVTVTQKGQIKTISCTAGSLALSAGNDIGQITRLKITGPIDARDFKTMRDLMPNLTDIDLREANIVAYTGSEGTIPYASAYPSNTIPEYAFYNYNNEKGKEILKEIILPQFVTSIANYAFKGCTSLYLVEIPETVSSINDYAFNNCSSLKNIVLPPAIKKLGFYSFSGSGLISIKIPASISVLNDNTFSYCTGLTKVNFPVSLTTIGSYSFYNCTSIDTLYISAATIGYNAFSGCNSLKLLVLAETVSEINSSAFYGCQSLSSIFVSKSLPVDLTNSGQVFYNVNKQTCKLYVPKGSIGLYSVANQWKDFLTQTEMPVFSVSTKILYLNDMEASASSFNISTDISWTIVPGASWIKVNPGYGKGNSQISVTASANQSFSMRETFLIIKAENLPDFYVNILQDGNSKNIQNNAGGLFTSLSATELKTVSKLKLTGNIDARDFKTMRDEMANLTIVNLKEATIVEYFGNKGPLDGEVFYPANTIPASSFYNPTLSLGKTILSVADLPESTTSIGNSAFRSCISLRSINIPQKVTNLGVYAFESCERLDSMIIPISVKEIPASCFTNCKNLKKVKLHPEITSIGRYAFQNCPLHSSFELPALLSFIGTAAFQNCSQIENITIHSSIGTLETSIFQYCPALQTVVLPENLKTIPGSMFAQCPKLSSINIPSKVESIGENAFNQCVSLKTIDLGVTAIGSNSFMGCTGLTLLRFPPKVKTIGGQAFAQCTNVKNIYAENKIPVNLSSSYNVFYGISASACNLHIPFGSLPLYATASQWKDFINIVEQPGIIVSTDTIRLLSHEGSSYNLNVKSNVNWTILNAQSWLTLNKTTGTGSTDVSVSAKANSTGLLRETKLLFTSNYTDTIKVVVLQTPVMTRIRTDPVNSEFKVFPNPSKGLIYFDYPEKLTQVRLDVFNSSGNEIETIHLTNKRPVNLNKLPDGVYYIRILSEGKEYYNKIILAK